MMRIRHALPICSVSALLLLASSAQSAEATIDRDSKHQTIEGFGFFGAHDVWWGSSSDVVNEDWVRLVIDDLGITMWRNEYYPPADDISGQDADWDKQRPVVELFKQVADERRVPLKFLLTVWSPPASMKCEVVDDEILEGTPHPDGTKGGGALCPSQRSEFAAWLVEGLDLHADVGVDVYALSFQNEPFFWQSYNSCFYAQDWYAETLADIGPIIKASYPEVKLFGSENMLEIECGRSDAGEFDPWWYTGILLDQPTALNQLDAWAVHGYSDGVNATPTSKMARLWSEFYGAVGDTGKPVWMTETSGYDDSWEGGELPGAIDLAQGMYAALRYGDLSAWVWWQGSELGGGGPSEYALMGGTEYLGKRYYVSKNFYRFIRPGARRVAVDSDDDEVLVVAFEHEAMESFTVVAINVSQDDKPLALTGTNVPQSFELHRSSASEDCEYQGSVSADAIDLPARSVTTLVYGNVYEDQVDAGTGGSGGTGGTDPGAGGEPTVGGAFNAGGDPGAGGTDPGVGGGTAGGTDGTAGGDAVTGGSSSGTGGNGPAAGGNPDAGGADSGTIGSEPGGRASTGTGAAPGGGAASSGGTGGGAAPAGGTHSPGGAGSGEASKSDDDGSCSCTVPGRRTPARPWLPGLAALALVLTAARRRRDAGRSGPLR